MRAKGAVAVPQAQLFQIDTSSCCAQKSPIDSEPEDASCCAGRKGQRCRQYGRGGRNDDDEDDEDADEDDDEDDDGDDDEDDEDDDDEDEAGDDDIEDKLDEQDLTSRQTRALHRDRTSPVPAMRFQAQRCEDGLNLALISGENDR